MPVGPPPPPRSSSRGNHTTTTQHNRTTRNDDDIASAALSFGGVAASGVVGVTRKSIQLGSGPPLLPGAGLRRSGTRRKNNASNNTNTASGGSTTSANSSSSIMEELPAGIATQLSSLNAINNNSNNRRGTTGGSMTTQPPPIGGVGCIGGGGGGNTNSSRGPPPPPRTRHSLAARGSSGSGPPPPPTSRRSRRNTTSTLLSSTNNNSTNNTNNNSNNTNSNNNEASDMMMMGFMASTKMSMMGSAMDAKNLRKSLLEDDEVLKNCLSDSLASFNEDEEEDVDDAEDEGDGEDVEGESEEEEEGSAKSAGGVVTMDYSCSSGLSLSNKSSDLKEVLAKAKSLSKRELQPPPSSSPPTIPSASLASAAEPPKKKKESNIQRIMRLRASQQKSQELENDARRLRDSQTSDYNDDEENEESNSTSTMESGDSKSSSVALSEIMDDDDTTTTTTVGSNASSTNNEERRRRRSNGEKEENDSVGDNNNSVQSYPSVGSSYSNSSGGSSGSTYSEHSESSSSSSSTSSSSSSDSFDTNVSFDTNISIEETTLPDTRNPTAEGKELQEYFNNSQEGLRKVRGSVNGVMAAQRWSYTLSIDESIKEEEEGEEEEVEQDVEVEPSATPSKRIRSADPPITLSRSLVQERRTSLEKNELLDSVLGMATERRGTIAGVGMHAIAARRWKSNTKMISSPNNDSLGNSPGSSPENSPGSGNGLQQQDEEGGKDFGRRKQYKEERRGDDDVDDDVDDDDKSTNSEDIILSGHPLSDEDEDESDAPYKNNNKPTTTMTQTKRKKKKKSHHERIQPISGKVRNSNFYDEEVSSSDDNDSKGGSSWPSSSSSSSSSSRDNDMPDQSDYLGYINKRASSIADEIDSGDVGGGEEKKASSPPQDQTSSIDQKLKPAVKKVTQLLRADPPPGPPASNREKMLAGNSDKKATVAAADSKPNKFMQCGNDDESTRKKRPTLEPGTVWNRSGSFFTDTQGDDVIVGIGIGNNKNLDDDEATTGKGNEEWLDTAAQETSSSLDAKNNIVPSVPLGEGGQHGALYKWAPKSKRRSIDKSGVADNTTTTTNSNTYGMNDMMGLVGSDRQSEIMSGSDFNLDVSKRSVGGFDLDASKRGTSGSSSLDASKRGMSGSSDLDASKRGRSTSYGSDVEISNASRLRRDSKSRGSLVSLGDDDSILKPSHEGRQHSESSLYERTPFPNRYNNSARGRRRSSIDNSECDSSDDIWEGFKKVHHKGGKRQPERDLEDILGRTSLVHNNDGANDDDRPAPLNANETMTSTILKSPPEIITPSNQNSTSVQPSPFQSDISRVNHHREGDESSPDVTKEGPRAGKDGKTKQRSGKGSKYRRQASIDKGEYEGLSPIDKLKLAQKKLQATGTSSSSSSDEDDRPKKKEKFPKKDFVELLESSIRDIQKGMKQEDSDSGGESREDYRHNRRQLSRSAISYGSRRSQEHSISSLTPSKRKSPRSDRNGRKHRSSDGRSTGGKSRSSRSTGNHSRNSRRSSDNKSSRSRHSHRSRRSGGDDRNRHSKRRATRSSSRNRRASGASEWDTTPEISRSSGGRSPQKSPSKSLELAPIPKEAKRALSCIRGNEALPRERVVSSVVRRLVSRIDRVLPDSNGIDNGEGKDNENASRACCVAILPSPDENEGEDGREQNKYRSGAGEGKTTIAALTCMRGDIRTRYHQGIAWINRENRPLSVDFESYSQALSDICRQLGVKPQQLRLSPVVRTPGEDKGVADMRMKSRMIDARVRMGTLLASLQRKSRSPRKENGRSWATSVLIVLDDVPTQEDVEWFQFFRGGNPTGDQINDLLVTSRQTMLGEGSFATINLPPLETKEGIKLFLTEGNLPHNHPLANNFMTRSIIKACMLHPLSIKFAGRWLALKRATSRGQRGIDELLCEVQNGIISNSGVEGTVRDIVTDMTGKGTAKSAVDVLFSLLTRAMSPLVKGKETKIIRLCFSALMSVFCKDSCSALVPVEIATHFFLKVVENEKEILSTEDTFFQSNGRQSSKLVPEILGALGIFNITKHTTQAEGSERNESTIHIDHDLLRQFSTHIREDPTMSRLVQNCDIRWNKAYVESYFEQKAKYLWDDIQPDRSRKYALEKMPHHMINAEMYEDVDLLLQNESFIRGRFWSIGWTEGTRVHVTDSEDLCRRLLSRRQISIEPADDGDDSLGVLKASSSNIVNASKKLESVLMEEVARESGGPNGRCTTLEAGRCLHEISVSLARCGLWDEAARFCNSCVELVESNLGPSELVASLLFNSSIVHTKANYFDEAEKKIGDCLDMRVKTCGTESILYVRALCHLGEILSISSDYVAAESCLNKSIGILKGMPEEYLLDFGFAIYKLARNHHRRGGFLDEAFHCYKDAIEFEKDELGSDHIFVPSALLHIGDVMVDQEDYEQAKQAYQEALEILTVSNVPELSSDSFEVKMKTAIAEGKLLSLEGQSEKCVQKYATALRLLQIFAPTRKRKIAQLNALLALECQKKGVYTAAEKFYHESVSNMKYTFGEFHLDIAETLVNLSGVKSAIGAARGNPPNCEQHAQATACLEEAIDIQKSRLGECEECAITLTIFGAHLRTIGDFKKAERAYNDAIRILQSLEGDYDLSLIDSYLGMAELMSDVWQYDDAMECYDKCIKLQQSLFGDKHEDIASTFYAMGLSKYAEGLVDKALILFAKALVMRVELHGETHSSVGDTYDMMAYVEAKNKNYDTALRRLTEALKVRKEVGDKLKEADTLTNIGNLHRETKEFELAVQHYDESLNVRISFLGETDMSVAESYMALGNVKNDMGKTQESLEHYREALKILISLKGPAHSSVGSVFEKIGMLLFRSGNLEGASLSLQQAIEVYRAGGADNETKIITPMFVLGQVLSMLKQSEEAELIWEDAYKTNQNLGDRVNPEIQNVLSRMLQA